jgi:DNA-binding Xre family transcriptional regulator
MMMINQTKLKKILESKNMSQTDLYDKIKSTCVTHLGKDVISKIVTGKKQNFELFTLLKICVALNVTPNDLIEKEEFIKTQIKN